MRWTMGLLMALAAQAPQAKERDEQALLQGYAYQLAVAEAPGDVHSDQRLAKVLELIISARTPANPDAPSHSEAMTLFLARAQAVAAQLEAQVDAARDADPALLAADLGCWPRTDDTRVCDARRARLEALAGDNAYHGLVLMETAWMLEDAAGFLRAARLAAAAPEYDSWAARDYRSLLARFRQAPVPEMPGMGPMAQQYVPELLAVTFLLAMDFPPHQNFSQPCRESEGELRAHCLAIARKMLDQGSNLTEAQIGASVVKAIGSPDDVAQAVARLREMEWLMAKAVPLLSAAETVAVAGMDDFFEAFAESGETAAMQALLARHRIPLVPPEGWTKAAPKAAVTP